LTFKVSKIPPKTLVVPYTIPRTALRISPYGQKRWIWRIFSEMEGLFIDKEIEHVGK